MVYTVTLNPALDYVMQVKRLNTGAVCRSERETFFAGGKGINVSWILRELWRESVALGFVAGFTGAELERILRKNGVQTDFITLPQGMTRVNVKIKSGEETDLNAKGPDISPADFEALLQKLDRLSAGDILVLSGSVGSAPKDSYQQIMSRLRKRGIRFVVDAAGEELRAALTEKPFLVKPNHHELGDFFGVRLTSREEVASYALKLRDMGAQNVLVSMAGDGAVLADGRGNIHMQDALCGQVLNSVGAGDSMVAGFLAGWLKNFDYDYALSLGCAAGSATAFSEGLADRESILRMLAQTGTRYV